MVQNNTSDEVWMSLVQQQTGCKNAEKIDTVQSLWSGFGSLFRVQADVETLIVKHVIPGAEGHHPRGWSGDFARTRKIKSYAVEIYWYQHLSHLCNGRCRVPYFRGAYRDEQQSVLLLEDLDHAGFPIRYSSLSLTQALYCVDWLANFHARFLGFDTDGLWPVGTYWHLSTRPDEYAAMADGVLKTHARQIDRILEGCRYRTLVHGDAKVANFCFSAQEKVAAVDFQYIGGGCGMKDLAYFIGSCFNEDECEAYASELLNKYFATLKQNLSSTVDAQALENEWRRLYPLAWTDFYRFLAGWMPTHQKIHRYTRRMAEQTFDLLSEYPEK